MTGKAILYAAKSTEDTHGSIATQLADARKLAEREGFEIAGEFHDEGFSAYTGNRGPGLEEARALAIEHAPSVLIAQHSDRVARGAGDSPDAPQHLIEVVTSLRRAGVTLRTVQDDHFKDEHALLWAALMGQRNTEDSARKSAAVKDGKRRAFERGDFPGGPIPDGFERTAPGEVRLDPDRIEVIRTIGELTDDGWGDPSLARELNRRGYRTKGGGAWTRRRVQDLLTNVLYYGGIAWHRGTESEEINWTGHVAPWTRADYERRLAERAGRDNAPGATRSPRGRPHSNHALARLAVCGRCLRERGELVFMNSLTSGYRRKRDGSRRRSYVCPHVKNCTGLCDMPPVDAEAVDTGVVNELREYLGDFERWRDQLLDGYDNERERLRAEVEKARAAVTEQEKVCAKRDRLPDLASDDTEAREALRLIREASTEMERRTNRLEAAETALADVPDEAPADAMLDFYNELGEAVRGRLEGANTLARVNDALRDVFAWFMVEVDPGPPDWAPVDGVVVMPMLRDASLPLPDGFVADPDEEITPPLRPLNLPSGKLANAQASANCAQALPPIRVGVAVD